MNDEQAAAQQQAAARHQAAYQAGSMFDRARWRMQEMGARVDKQVCASMNEPS